MVVAGGWQLVSSQSHKKERSLSTPGDVEFADDTVTCSSASAAPAVEQLFDETLRDWSQRRNTGKTERLLVVPNAPRVQVGLSEQGCLEARPRVKVVRHVGGFLSADGRHDQDTSHRVSRARRMVGMLARAWARQKDGPFLPVMSPPEVAFDEGPC